MDGWDLLESKRGLVGFEIGFCFGCVLFFFWWWLYISYRYRFSNMYLYISILVMYTRGLHGC